MIGPGDEDDTPEIEDDIPWDNLEDDGRYDDAPNPYDGTLSET